jgi:hypothetical protein
MPVLGENDVLKASRKLVDAGEKYIASRDGE